MSTSNGKSRMVSFRLPNADYRRIEQLLKGQMNPHTSVSDYCKQNIIRWLHRHDKQKTLTSPSSVIDITFHQSNYITDQFIDRLIQADWTPEEAAAEFERIQNDDESRY